MVVEGIGAAIARSFGGQAFAVGGDASEEADVLAMVARTVETYGLLDILVNTLHVDGGKTLYPEFRFGD